MSCDKATTVLIVEDEHLPATYLCELLEKEGYRIVAVCDTGRGAIEAARKDRPEIVLMDIMLKGTMSGCEAALRIKSELPETKLIFLTAYIDAEMIFYASEAGACNYLLKPYNDTQILATLHLASCRAPSHSGRCSLLHLGGEYFYDTRSKKLYAETKELLLSPKKRKLITLLIEAKGAVVPYATLCQAIFDDENRYGALRTLVSRLNHKLGFSLIENVAKEGYVIRYT